MLGNKTNNLNMKKIKIDRPRVKAIELYSYQIPVEVRDNQSTKAVVVFFSGNSEDRLKKIKLLLRYINKLDEVFV